MSDKVSDKLSEGCKGGLIERKLLELLLERGILILQRLDLVDGKFVVFGQLGLECGEARFQQVNLLVFIVNHFLLQLTLSHIRVSIILFTLSIYYASFLSAYKEQCHLSIFDRSDTHKKRKSFDSLGYLWF